jgi:hypothetical protein
MEACVLGPRDTDRSIQEHVVSSGANPSPEPYTEPAPETVGTGGDGFGCALVASVGMPELASGVPRGMGADVAHGIRRVRRSAMHIADGGRTCGCGRTGSVRRSCNRVLVTGRDRADS